MFTVGVGVTLPILLLLVPPLIYGELKCCSNFLRGRRRYAAPNVLLVFGAQADVYAVEGRGRCLVL